jgi:predicted transcriptional regulator
VEKIEKGMRQYENGQILTEEELNKEMEKWFK